MYIQLVCIIPLFDIVYANSKNHFILDFFIKENIKSVVGFSCNEKKDDFSLVKSFSSFGIYISIQTISNVHSLQRLASTYHRKVGVFFDRYCLNLYKLNAIFSTASEFQMFGELHSWLMIASSSNIGDIPKIIRDDSFGVSTSFVVALPHQNDSFENYDLYDTYNTWKSRGGKLNMTFMGTWDQIQHIRAVFNNSRFERRSNMHGLSLRIIIHHNVYRPPDMRMEDYLLTYTIPPKESLSKFGYIMISHLTEFFNLTLYSREAGIWTPDIKKHPLVAKVLKKEFDMVGNPLIMYMERSYEIKHLHLSWPFRTIFFFRTPQPTDIKTKEILGPFEIDVWISLLIYFILSTFILGFLFGCEDTIYYANSFARFSNSFITLIGAVCQQGTDFIMDKVSTRIYFITIMMSCLMIFNYYSSCVISARLNEQIIKMNDSLNELAKSGLKVASESMNYFEFLIKRPDWEIEQFYQKCWRRVPPVDQFIDPDKGMLLAKKGGFAYHTHPEIGYFLVSKYYDNNEICELTEVHLQRPNLGGFTIDINSTMIEFFRVGFTKMAEVGVRKRQVDRLSTPRPPCDTNILSAASIQMNEVALHLIILFSGMALAIFIYVVERIKWNPANYMEHDFYDRNYYGGIL